MAPPSPRRSERWLGRLWAAAAAGPPACPPHLHTSTRDSFCSHTLSRSMHAYALELLSDRLQPGARVLDVGSGTGCGARVGPVHRPASLPAAACDAVPPPDSCPVPHATPRRSYLTAAFALLVCRDGGEGKALGIEHIPGATVLCWRYRCYHTARAQQAAGLFGQQEPAACACVLVTTVPASIPPRPPSLPTQS